jgi:hypothetical protein
MAVIVRRDGDVKSSCPICAAVIAGLKGLAAGQCLLAANKIS